MPFASNADLPDRVRSRFSEHEQTVYRKAFNSAWSGVCKDGGRQGDREGCSFAVAATAVKQAKGAPMKKLAELIKAILQVDEPDLEGGSKDRESVAWVVPIAKVDQERRLIASVVYEPDVVDAHDDGMTSAEIEKACHAFGIHYAQGRGELGTDHARKASRLEIVPVETFLAPVDFELGKQLVHKGSWVMWSKVIDDELWRGIKSGEYTGYSFEGYGRRVPA